MALKEQFERPGKLRNQLQKYVLANPPAHG